MSQDEFKVLTPLLNALIATFTAGQARIVPEALWLLQALAVIELTLFGMWYMMSRDIHLAMTIMRVAQFGFFSWLISHWGTVTKWLIRFFMTVGLKAGGDAISETDFTDPDNIAGYGPSVVAVVFQHLREYAGLDALKNIVEILFSGGTAFLIIVIYFVIALWIFIALLEFYAFTAISVFLLPFGIWNRTAWIAEKTMGSLVGYAVHVLALSFTTGVMLPVLVRLQTGLNPGFADVLKLFLGAAAMGFLVWKAHSTARVFLSGTPQLTIDDVRYGSRLAGQSIQRLGQAVATAITTGLAAGRAAGVSAAAHHVGRRAGGTP